MHGIARLRRRKKLFVIFLAIVLVALIAWNSKYRRKQRASLASEGVELAEGGPDITDEAEGPEVSKVVKTLSRPERWEQTKYFSAKWLTRANWSISLAKRHFRRRFFQKGFTVLELGCGPYQPVKRLLAPKSVYYGADIVRRTNDSLIVDLNLDDNEMGHEFKGEHAQSLEAIRLSLRRAPNLLTLIAVIEYVIDVARLFKQLRRFDVPILLTYVPTDREPNMEKRKNSGWQNHLSRDQLQAIFCKQKFSIWGTRGQTYLLLPSQHTAFSCS
mmetsp:Transcript_4466/g.6914  ORF Transcript_4466/g.6914 Transcript_4466/m.6914 type:complete len:272 (-) Transcript_4466:869-1684(-)